MGTGGKLIGKFDLVHKLSEDVLGEPIYEYVKRCSYKSSLIYCDPPYFGTKQYGVSKDFNHLEFWQWVREQSKNNIVLVSEETAPEDFTSIWEREVQRSIKSDEKWSKTEKLWTLTDN